MEGRREIEKWEKYYNFMKHIPTIIFWIILLASVVWAIVDLQFVGPIVNEVNFYEEAYGVLGLSEKFEVFLVWVPIGLIVGIIELMFGKYRICTTVLKVEYLKQIEKNTRKER